MSAADQRTRVELEQADAAQLRASIRSGRWRGPTAGLARGHVQANLVILPADDAADFAEFCRLNPRACPLLEQLAPGQSQPARAAAGADLRTDVPRYRVFRRGELEAAEPTDIRPLWREDLVSFLLGCSFTFENALVAAGLEVRHIAEDRNVPMYRTGIECQKAGRFEGNLVVSMRPFAQADVERVIALSGEFPEMHGAPIHVGDPADIGIRDLSRPEFGEAVTVREGEVPVYWACGVTPQVAILAARPELAITHSPGCMFVTDWIDSQWRTA